MVLQLTVFSITHLFFVFYTRLEETIGWLRRLIIVMIMAGNYCGY